MKQIIPALIVACLSLAAPSEAGVRVACRSHVANAVVIQAVPFAYAAHGYQVGGALQAQAIAELAAERAVAKYAAQVQAQGGAVVQGQVQQTQLQVSCIKCHEQRGIRTDLTADDAIIRESVRRMMLPLDDPDHMPKGIEFSKDDAELAGDIIRELTERK